MPDGTRIRVSISAAPVYDEAGKLIAAVAAFFDVTELRDALHRQNLLLDEINHRVKNTLATVQSIAMLTRGGSGTVDEYIDGFQRRILALSRAYNLLTDNNWQGTNLHQIVSATVEPYGSAGSDCDRRSVCPSPCDANSCFGGGAAGADHQRGKIWLSFGRRGTAGRSAGLAQRERSI